MENSEDENIQTLLSMGFYDVSKIRKALHLGKGDLNEAVSYLTSEVPMSPYSNEMDVNNGASFNSAAPPAYNSLYSGGSGENIEATGSSATNNNTADESMQEEPVDDGMVFPYRYLVELEGRVYTEEWSIPYRTDESFALCLISAQKLIEHDVWQTDEHCIHFLDRCMPECFNKLLKSSAVQRWPLDVQEGILEMIKLFMDMLITRLSRKPLPVDMLKILALAFDPETDWHFKNRSRHCPKITEGERFAQAPISSSSFYNEPYGWLVFLIHTFCENNGLTKLSAAVEENDSLDAVQFAAVLKPFGVCADYLNANKMQELLSPIIERAGKYVRELTEEDFKQKKLGSVSELLTMMKLVYRSLWSKDISSVDDLRLSVTLRMLKSPPFNAKMNALNEITKLIDDSKSFTPKIKKNAMSEDKVREWLRTNGVLRIALDGHVDQSQYCDKIRTMVDFIGESMTMDELTHLWKMQNDHSLAVSENIQSVLSDAAVHFNEQQLDQLFLFIHSSWKIDDEKRRQRLVSFIGRIGHHSKSLETMEKILFLLWDLAHLSKLPARLVERALTEHQSILSDSVHVKDSLKKKFVLRCVEDIKKDTWLVPALSQMHEIVLTFSRPRYNKTERGILNEINRQHDLLKLITTSLSRCHKMAVNIAHDKRTALNGDLMVDDRYKHSDYMWNHLKFLRFLLKDANLYLPYNRAKEIWDTLVNNKDACHEDCETCYDWFGCSLNDLENDTIKTLFRERILKLEPSQLSLGAYHCLMKFLEASNVNDQKMKKINSLSVEKLDFSGCDFMWKVCIECPCEEVAEMAIDKLVCYSYTYVSSSHKRDLKNLHNRFISECYKRLQAAMQSSDSSSKSHHAVNKVTKTLTATIIADSSQAMTKACRDLSIERILKLAVCYIMEVEKSYSAPRSILPHGGSFIGYPLKIKAVCDTPYQTFTIMTHSNETVSNLRSRIATKLNFHSSESIQIWIDDNALQPQFDHQYLHMCNFDYYQEIHVKTTVSSAAIVTDEDGCQPNKNAALVEIEQKLPSVLMANKGKGMFESLYQLTEMNMPSITQHVRSLLMLIPNDPHVHKLLLSLGTEVEEESKGHSRNKSGGTFSFERPMGLNIEHSPKKQRNSRLPSLQSLFSLSNPSINIFRLRYNLEVLSSLLMPVSDQQLSSHDPVAFVQKFLEHGGMQVVLNILQKEVISSASEQDADADTRRGCYAIALTIARFLLCDHRASDEDDPMNTSDPFDRYGTPRLSISVEAAATPTSPKREYFDSSMSSVATDSAATPTKKNRRSPPASLSQSPNVVSPNLPKAARSSVQLMNEEDFTALITTLVRISWFASASKLDQVTTSRPGEHDGTSFARARRWSKDSNHSAGGFTSNVSPYFGRQTSTGSSSSVGSAESESFSASQDAAINYSSDGIVAQQSLELLVTCLELRSSHIDCFFDLPAVCEFIIDLLTKPLTEDVRDCAVEQFHILSKIPTASKRSTRQFLAQIIMNARLPFWNQSTFLRHRTQVIVRNCLQFFQLRSLLIQDIVNHDEEVTCNIDTKQMLTDEINWLCSFEIPSSVEYFDSFAARVLDNTLLTGHLRLIETLISVPTIDKKVIGSKLISKVLNDFLFPASNIILESSRSQQYAHSQPICSSELSRGAAFGVLCELCRDCTENTQQVSLKLRTMHHYTDASRAKEFDFQPLVDPRPEHGLVGLKNAGATCYMNSVLQQLFMIKGLSESVLSSDVESNDDPESILFELQKMFGHLTESRLQYHIPETFWKNFKLWGQPINVREQRDAYMFFTDLSSQVDDYLKQKQLDRVFEKTFHGLFSDQKICDGCPHRYEREEPYFALNLPVKCGNLLDSLQQFVAGEKMDGDNMYFCEKCNTKRAILKRTCIKTLPPILLIQLKRFEYDWNSGRSLKFDQLFQFPMDLDMTPYTVDSIAKQEGSGVRSRHNTLEQHQYELVGITVHSGQANAGHYYSFIKDRRGSMMTNRHFGKWFKFNDTTVEEFDMNDNSLAEECFGGTFKRKIYDKGSSYEEDRLRYWNGYLLFYEKKQLILTRSKTSMSAKQKVTFKELTSPMPSSPDISPPTSPKQSADRLSQLSRLIKKSDRTKMFCSGMPASISQLVFDENLQFMRNRDIYCEPYFNLVKNIASVNLLCIEQFPAIAVASLQLSMQFLFNTYFRTRSSLRRDIDDWQRIIDEILTKSQPVCIWLLSQLNNDFNNITLFLLECPDVDVRQFFVKILLKTFSTLSLRKTNQDPAVVDDLVKKIVGLLETDVVQHVKHSQQYFDFIQSYAALGHKSCSSLLRHNTFVSLLRFLLGESTVQSILANDNTPMDVEIGSGDAPEQSVSMQTDEETSGRRWSSVLSREFANVHKSIVNIVLHCDLSNMWTVPHNGPLSSCNLQTLNVKQKLPLPQSLRKALFDVSGKKLIREFLIASREVSSSLAVVSDLLVYCSHNNQTYSSACIHLILNEITKVAANELTSLLSLLLNLLCIEDSIHLSRLAQSLENDENAILKIIKNSHNTNGPKCYQCIKLLVHLASKTQINKDYLKSISSQWSWSVSWLKDKMALKTDYNLNKGSDLRSNESSTSKFFQRTMSAQNTLQEATALLDSEKNEDINTEDGEEMGVQF